MLTVLSALVVAPLTVASAQQPDETRVDVNLKDADLLTATRALTQRTGINFVIEPSKEGFSPVTLQVAGVTAEDAIRYICLAAGATFRKEDGGVYVIGHDLPKEETAAPAAPPAPIITRKIKILKVKATDVYREMVEMVPLVSNDPFTELKKFSSLSQQDITSVTNKYSLQQNPNGMITNYSAQAASPSNVPLTGSESGNQIALPGESANQGFGGIGAGGGGGIGGQGGGGIGGGGIGGQGGRGGIGGQGGQGNATLTGGQGLVPAGINFISYNPTDNSLIVQGPEDAIEELQRRVSQFDVAPRQVVISVEFITTSENLSKDFGAELNYSRGTEFLGAIPGQFVNQSDPVLFGYSTGNVAFRLRTYLTEGHGKVVNAPIVRTMNNTFALVSSTYYSYFFFSQVAATNGVFIQTFVPEQYQATTELAVDPRINEDGTVSMALTPTVSAIVGTTTDPEGNEYPNEVVQFAEVIARVRSGHTMVIAGLTATQTNSSVNKFPVLGDLPIIGQFFRHTEDQVNNNELLIFVTPTILPEDSDNDSLGGP